MVGRQVVADPEALLEVALLLLVGVEVLHAQVEPAAVAGGPLDGHLGLLLARQREEAGGLGEGPVDQVLVDAVAGEVGEADVAERAGELQRGPLAVLLPAAAEGSKSTTGTCSSGMRSARRDGAIFGGTPIR
jgi:hypothetical protein